MVIATAVATANAMPANVPASITDLLTSQVSLPILLSNNLPIMAPMRGVNVYGGGFWIPYKRPNGENNPIGIREAMIVTTNERIVVIAITSILKMSMDLETHREKLRDEIGQL